jgi:protein TonB
LIKYFVLFIVFLCSSCVSTNTVISDKEWFRNDSKARYIESCLKDNKGENERCTCEANVKVDSFLVTKNRGEFKLSLIGPKEAYSEKLNSCKTTNAQLTEATQPIIAPKVAITKIKKRNEKYYTCISPKEYSEVLLKERGCKVYNDTEVTEPAKALVTIGPRYPPFAAKNNISGYIKAELIINEIGGVVNVKIIESVPVGIFDKEGINVLKRWKYKPAMLKTAKVIQKVTLTLEFKIST